MAFRTVPWNLSITLLSYIYIFRNKTYFLMIRWTICFMVYLIQLNIGITLRVEDYIFMICTSISWQEFPGKKKIYSVKVGWNVTFLVFGLGPRNLSLYWIAYTKCSVGFQFQSQVSNQILIGVFFWKYYIIVHFIILIEDHIINLHLIQDLSPPSPTHVSIFKAWWKAHRVCFARLWHQVNAHIKHGVTGKKCQFIQELNNSINALLSKV